MTPYYSKNFGIKSLIKSAFVRNSEAVLIDFFRDYTRKKYILLTSSCRSALFLSYKGLELSGDVVTSPLTCKVAIDPIVSSGNNPKYIDIEIDSFSMKMDSLAAGITKETKAIQVIHIGGIPSNPSKIRKFCDEIGVFMIEDCAQGFMSFENGLPCGSLGDVSCFSLIKNAYGIGGGVLATDDKEIFLRAKKLNDTFPNLSKSLIVYRIIRNILETNRTRLGGEFLFSKLLRLRNKNKNKKETLLLDTLTKMSSIEKRIAAVQIQQSRKLNGKRVEVALRLNEECTKIGIKSVAFNRDEQILSYTKFYISDPRINSKKDIKRLNELGIEAKHLEQKINSYYQEKLTEEDLINYNNVHDHLLSIPLREDFNQKDINKIIQTLKKVIK